MNHQTEQYIRKLFSDAQEGLCPICLKQLADTPLTTYKLSMDHDHATGEPRGLLHQSCNMKVAQIETHTRKLNYIISRQLEARIRDYISEQHYHIQVSLWDSGTR